MAPAVKRFLQEAGVHPFQLSPTGWQAVLGTYMLWWDVHGVVPSLEEYKATFSLRPSNRPGLFYAYKFGTEVILGKHSPKGWFKMWCFMGGNWEGEGDPSGWAYRVPRSFGAAGWSGTRPRGPASLINRSNMILDLPKEKKDRWVVLSEENLRKHNLGARDVETHQTQIGKGALHLSQVGSLGTKLTILFLFFCSGLFR